MSRSGSTSRSLLVRARHNEPGAWDRLVSLYAPLVMHWLRRANVPESDAADVFQEVFRGVAAGLGNFRKDHERDTFRGWLRTITRHKVHDHFQRLGREPQGAGGTEAGVFLAQVPSPAPFGDADDHADDLTAPAELMRRALEQVREHFHESTWKAFWRTVVDAQPATDVAQELSMSAGAVRVAKSRVLQRLREELGDLIE
jgi:RNA polymerase sigma-70 factor (ECF subfamily)